VLEGRLPPSSAPLRAKGPYVVVVFETVRDEDAREREDPERVLSVVSLYCEDAHPDAMCAFIDDRFWALMPVGRANARERVVALAGRIAERAERALGVRLIGGVGLTVAHVSDVPDSRRTAEQALTVLAARDGGGRVADIEEVRAHAVLLDLLRLGEKHPALLAGKVADLVAADREDGTRHASTLRVYLDAWGDMARAARASGVHVNTMRYRVRKALERSGLDLDDPAERIVSELQLRLHARVDV
jgi:DNA-binding PucR family transcriptional regulator